MQRQLVFFWWTVNTTHDLVLGRYKLWRCYVFHYCLCVKGYGLVLSGYKLRNVMSFIIAYVLRVSIESHNYPTF